MYVWKQTSALCPERCQLRVPLAEEFSLLGEQAAGILQLATQRLNMRCQVTVTVVATASAAASLMNDEQ